MSRLRLDENPKQRENRIGLDRVRHREAGLNDVIAEGSTCETRCLRNVKFLFQQILENCIHIKILLVIGGLMGNPKADVPTKSV